MTEYFIIITMQGANEHGGLRTTNFHAIRPVDEGGTRAELFQWMLAQLPPEFAGFAAIFFSAEPNQLGGA